MVSFAEFMIKFFEKLGVFYIFSLIFIGVIFYFMIYFILSTIKVENKQLFDDKTRKSISILLAFVVALLAGHVYNISLLIRYFLSMLAIMTIVIFFIILIYSFISGKRESLPNNWKRNVVILIIVFLVIFVFISLYYAFKDYFISLNMPTSGPGMGTYNPEAELFRLIWKPEILIIPFLFIFFGFVAWILGREEESRS